MKKLTAILLVLALVISASFAQGAQETAVANEGDSELVKAAKAEGELVVYGSCEEEYLRSPWCPQTLRVREEA